MEDIIIDLISVYGLLMIFTFMLTNGIISAPPSELVISLGGMAIATNTLVFHDVLLAILAGNFLGAVILYNIGKMIDIKKLHANTEKVGRFGKLRRFLRIPSNDHLLAFGNYLSGDGGHWIGILRCVPVVRSIISLPAGIFRMPISKFAIYSLIGIFLWAIIWITIGYFFFEIYNQHGVTALFFSIILMAVALHQLNFRYRKWEAQVVNNANNSPHKNKC